MESEWLSTHEAAHKLGLSVASLYALLDKGTLPSYRFGRSIKIRVTELEEFIEARKVVPGELAHLHFNKRTDST